MSPCPPRRTIPGGTTKIPVIYNGDFLFLEMFTTYVLYSSKVQKKYTGHTNDLDRRIKEHNLGLLGISTKNKGPWVLIYSEQFNTRSEAILREKELKTGKGREFIKNQTGL